MSIVPASSNSIFPEEVRELDFCTERYEKVSHKCTQIMEDTVNTIFINPPDNAFINLNKSKLIVKGRIKKATDENLDYVAEPLQYSQVSPINAFVWSMWKTFNVYAGRDKKEVLFKSNHGLYGTVNYIKELKKAKYGQRKKRNIIFAIDNDGGVQINTVGGGSEGLENRALMFKNSNTVTMVADLNFPAANKNILLPCGLNLMFEFELASNQSNLIIPTALFGGDNNQNQLPDVHYKFELLGVEIQLCQVYLKENPFIAYTALLKENPFLHFIDDYEIKVNRFNLFCNISS